MSIELVTLCNTRTLTELSQLLRFMSDEIYQKQSSNDQGEPVSSIGAHCRHIIEFYHCFFQGLSQGTIDYDARIRNHKIELSKAVAMTQLETACKMMGLVPAMEHMEKPLILRAQIDVDLAAITTRTSAERELIFLQNHSVHHLALISMLLNSYGQSTPEEFGMANATQIYRSKQKAD